MRKIVIAPDSFKGALSAQRAALAIAQGVSRVFPSCRSVLVPIADGGEGSVEALGAEKIPCRVKDALGREIDSFWGRLGNTAVIEIAACVGLSMLKKPDPEKTGTWGVGQLILSALSCGIRDFILCLGGSSTNDLGCGMAAALGYRFLDEKGMAFVPTGKSLAEIALVDTAGVDPRLSSCRFTAMCDVDNPLYGPCGAAYVFAPQKGASPEAVRRLDEGLRVAAEKIEASLGCRVAQLPGAGAAGGCGAGAVAFLSAELKRGIDVVLEAKDFSRELCDCDLVITGEGSFDDQSVDGKAISGIAARAKEKGVPVVVLAGRARESFQSEKMGVSAVFSIQREANSLPEAIAKTEENLMRTTTQILRLIREVKK